MKKIFIKSFGCQMNARDSEYVAGVLLDNGFRLADSFDDADVILFNSCSVRKHAEDRLFANIGELKHLKKKKPGLVIGLMGCTAQNYGGEILKKAPLVDFVCGPGNEWQMPQMVKDIIKNRCAIIATDRVSDKRPELFPEYRESSFRAYVSIGEGCNNFCSYCIVPYVRGRERSREAKDIVREVKDLAERGFKEITLLGQNVNSYSGIGDRGSGTVKGVRPPRFITLLEELNSIKGIERIRFMTSHPKDASSELFKAVRDLDKVCEHLHLPLQSGSDRILKLMNRKYTAKKYLKLAEEYKKIVPNGALTTDIIVGFPSESKDDFKKTKNIMERIGFDSAFLFKYSPRPPAKSARLKDGVLAEEKEGRLKALLDLQERISYTRNTPLDGKIVEALVDGVNKKDRTLFTGRTRTNKVVVFDGEKSLIGKFIDVKIEKTASYVLRGRRV
jgi:tRNA-2-methylthio-N6-dimethylallyladenosine synthase